MSEFLIITFDQYPECVHGSIDFYDNAFIAITKMDPPRVNITRACIPNVLAIFRKYISSYLIQQNGEPYSLLNIISLSIVHIQLSWTSNIEHNKLSS